MAWSGYQMTDPNDIEARFSNEDALSEMASIFTDPSEESLVEIDRIRKMLDQIPAREADFIDLYFFRHFNQTDIADMFGVSQPTVCYRLKRAVERIRYLRELPDISREELEAAMSTFLEPLDTEIMVLMWETTCQSEVAKRLGVTQGKVRHRFMRAVKKMGSLDNMGPIPEMFGTIAANLNILREVRRPSWDSRLTHVIY